MVRMEGSSGGTWRGRGGEQMASPSFGTFQGRRVPNRPQVRGGSCATCPVDDAPTTTPSGSNPSVVHTVRPSTSVLTNSNLERFRTSLNHSSGGFGLGPVQTKPPSQLKKYMPRRAWIFPWKHAQGQVGVVLDARQITGFPSPRRT